MQRGHGAVITQSLCVFPIVRKNNAEIKVFIE